MLYGLVYSPPKGVELNSVLSRGGPKHCGPVVLHSVVDADGVFDIRCIASCKGVWVVVSYTMTKLGVFC
jgi:hypothetical protein